KNAKQLLEEVLIRYKYKFSKKENETILDLLTIDVLEMKSESSTTQASNLGFFEQDHENKAEQETKENLQFNRQPG
ncbi:hypothetical protein WJ883_09905, partial [Coxiella burnetii]